MADLRLFGNTSNLIRFTLKNSSTGAGLTGLTGSSAGLIISTIADVEASATAYTQAATHIQTIATLGTFAAPSASSCRFGEVDATNHPGLYEFQFADARFAVSNARRLVISVSGAASLLSAHYEIELVQFNPFDAVRLGLTALPSAAVGSGANSFNFDASGNVASNSKAINSVSTSSVVEIDAYLGTTQKPTYDANNFLKIDLVDIAGAAVSASTAQLGVNLVNAAGAAVTLDANNVLNVSAKYLAGTALTGRDIGASVLLSNGTGTGQVKLSGGYVAPNWGDVGNPTTTLDLSGTTVKNLDGNTVQTGDSYARIGAAGASLTGITGVTLAASQPGVTIPTVTTLTNLPAIPANWLTAAGIAASALNGKGDWSTYAGGDTAGTTTLLSRLTAPILFDGNGYVKADVEDWLAATAPAMTGDAYARIGAPVGASISADLAAVKTDVDAIPTDPYTGTPPTAADIAAAVLTDTSDLTTSGSIGYIIAHQLGGAFTSASSSVFTVAALANAPSGGGGPVTVGGYASGQDPATLVLDAMQSAHDSVGTIGYAIGAAGGAADPLLNTVPGSYASGTAGYVLGSGIPNAIAALTAAGITYVGPINPITGQASLVRGDDYDSADPGRALSWNAPVGGGVPDLTGATVTAYFFPAATVTGANSRTPAPLAVLTAGVAVASPGTSSQTVTLDSLPGTDTALLDGAQYALALIAVLADGHTETILRAKVTVSGPGG